jgi:hypothetical protein
VIRDFATWIFPAALKRFCRTRFDSASVAKYCRSRPCQAILRGQRSHTHGVDQQLVLTPVAHEFAGQVRLFDGGCGGASGSALLRPALCATNRPALAATIAG